MSETARAKAAAIVRMCSWMPKGYEKQLEDALDAYAAERTAALRADYAALRTEYDKLRTEYLNLAAGAAPEAAP